MFIKLEFDEPSHISADSTDFDQMVVKFKNAAKLLIGENDTSFKGPDTIDSSITQMKKVPR